jgi:hypothetical protein
MFDLVGWFVFLALICFFLLFFPVVFGFLLCLCFFPIPSHVQDTEHKVRTITALAIGALAEASAPYGIESYDTVLKPLWYGIREQRGKGLAAFLKAIGFIIPLMDAENASYYTKEVMYSDGGVVVLFFVFWNKLYLYFFLGLSLCLGWCWCWCWCLCLFVCVYFFFCCCDLLAPLTLRFVLIREFSSPDEEMKKIVLKVVKQCVSTEGVEAKYIRTDILTPFFKHFWIRRMALDRRNYRMLCYPSQSDWLTSLQTFVIIIFVVLLF